MPGSQAEDDDLMTLREVCEDIGWSRNTVLRWIKKGIFPPPDMQRPVSKLPASLQSVEAQ